MVLAQLEVGMQGLGRICSSRSSKPYEDQNLLDEGKCPLSNVTDLASVLGGPRSLSADNTGSLSCLKNPALSRA